MAMAMAMAKLGTLCSPSTSSLSSLSPLPSLSLSSRHVNFPSFSLRIRPIISCSSSSTLATTENPTITPQSDEQEEVLTTRVLAQSVPWTSTADDIRALFEKFGTVVDVELSMHSKSRNRGLAFVEMGSAEEAAEALAKLENYEYQGRTLRLNYARPKKKKTPSPPESKPSVLYNLFVANLSFEARAKDLREFFQSSGCNAVSAEVIFHDNPRKSSGYGFVSFKTKREADEALSTFQGKELLGRPIRVARSNKFVKLESEMKPQSEVEEEDLLDTSGLGSSEHPETVNDS